MSPPAIVSKDIPDIEVSLTINDLHESILLVYFESYLIIIAEVDFIEETCNKSELQFIKRTPVCYLYRTTWNLKQGQSGLRINNILLNKKLKFC